MKFNSLDPFYYMSEDTLNSKKKKINKKKLRYDFKGVVEQSPCFVTKASKNLKIIAKYKKKNLLTFKDGCAMIRHDKEQ